ncbi:hypothetical protein ACEWY4_010353 [Coilia grayii]|uniref:Protein phosphatase 1 regulatory subunit 15A/B C-terminal domain-containing protein n=1 Tax=Coilia grayii TaxID=363190 RepID=A0ABD1K1M6_9TELE
METECEKQNMDRSAMNRFGDSGTMILPWTKQILFVLWEQLRFLVHLIYYSFMSVFQMFRVEVHLRISEETGPHIQHISTPGTSAEGFFLSSLFDNNKSVIVSSSSPLSKLSGDLTGTHPGSLLSSLVSDELCCSLVDDFVARAAEGFSDSEDLSIGHHASWKLGCPSEWNVFVGSEKVSSSNSDDPYYTSSHEDKVFSWENDTSTESDIVSASYDPYKPLSFSASIFGYSPRESAEKVEATSWELKVEASPSLEDNAALFCPAFAGRSDSESSWGSSDSSSADGDREESEKLWELFSSSSDPYHPLHFTACASSSKALKKDTRPVPKPDKAFEPTKESPSSTVTDTETTGPSPLSEDEEEALWQSLCHNDDPYHPLHFRACLSSSKANANANPRASSSSWTPANAGPDSGFISLTTSAFQCLGKSKKQHKRLCKRLSKRHCCTTTPDKPVLVPWKRKVKGQVRGKHDDQPAVKKVQFSPRVQVHKMRAWSFALQASRKGHWEELARDRDRFRRRVQETEQAIGYCLGQAHRERVLACQRHTGEEEDHGSEQNFEQLAFLS